MICTTIPVTYGYARVSKTDDARNWETHLHILQDYGIRAEHIFTGGLTGSSMSHLLWNELPPLVRPNDIIVVAWLDIFSRNSEEGVRIQAALPKQQLGIISINDDINTSDDSIAAKYFRRMIPGKGAHQMDAPASECNSETGAGPSQGRA